MAFIRTAAPQEAQAETAAMYARQQAAWGYVPNYARVFSHRPEVLARWGRLLAEIRRPMDARRFELVTFVAAHELRNSACTLAHGRALREFFTDAQIVAIAAGACEGFLGSAELAMLRLARQVVRDAAAVTAAQVDELTGHGLDDAEVFDIIAVAAGRAFFAKLLDGLGVQPDAPFLDLDAPLRVPLTVGRPVDTEPCVTLPTMAEGVPAP